MSIHNEMRVWRAHLRASRAEESVNILPTPPTNMSDPREGDTLLHDMGPFLHKGMLQPRVSLLTSASLKTSIDSMKKHQALYERTSHSPRQGDKKKR